jgi:type I restriction enzyme, S subunit
VRTLQEFRTRLIADVVTGQLDVRALAGSLPAVTALAPLDEADDDAFDEDADALEDEEADA